MAACDIRNLYISAFDMCTKLYSETIQNKKEKAVIRSFLKAFHHLYSPAKGWHAPQGLMIMKNVVLKTRNLS